MIFGVIFLVSLPFILFGDGEPDAQRVVAACERAARERLVAPATAQFPAWYDWEVRSADPRYWAFGYVDSENRLGATVRTDVGCELRWDGNTLSPVNVELTE